MEKILITGGNGVLGTKLIDAADSQMLVLATDVQNQPIRPLTERVRYARMDITDRNAVESVFTDFQPSAVIHAAAYTNVDGAETERETCFRINVLGTANLIRAAREAGAHFVYVSTDYVFDGTAGPYAESDRVNPLSWYGLTKYAGECIASGVWHPADEMVMTDYADLKKELDPLVIPPMFPALICRTMGLYGFSSFLKRFNFVGWLLTNLYADKPVKVVTDQMVNHTVADDLARTLYALMRRDGVSGVYHTAGEDWLSRYEFARRLAVHFGLNEELIEPVSSTQLGWKANRPLQGGLRMDKLHAVGLRMLDTASQLEVVSRTFIKDTA